MSVEKVLKQKYPRYAERLIAVWHNAKTGVNIFDYKY